ncbi:MULTISPECIES: hypothetical protein [Streptomyces]|uniref:Integral membrane protein n=1 Tax=Streptomyces spororaveus TaxID=284039 RepID=A0ABQ3TMT1_9ACTN|nr:MULTISPECIES: hypothetical protein [Streptomyces]MCM9077944.1 hypothetical protein [Streptomyces spororaveus]MCX5307575.1 hypothetical protein [Streptomyces sp. NBC_00160]GHI81701.1 hypothetical protein Sspor_72620 [Streptomyces spororaveus]
MSDDEGGGSLYVLTAVLLTPAQFPSILGDDFPEACSLLGVAPGGDGYGLVLGQDEEGARWTVVVDDVSLVATAIASWDCGMEYDLSPDERTIVVSLAGWPLELSVAASGIPEPHDPEQGADGTGRVPLAPPSAEAWGPVQRRMGADQIAREWADWRERVATDGGAAAAAHPGLARALEEAAGYTKSPPPPGRVRSSFAGEGVRTLRVDGPGWSLVARTGEAAFVLLDEEPSEVLAVPREGDSDLPDLPDLLTALDAIAVRPS